MDKKNNSGEEMHRKLTEAYESEIKAEGISLSTSTEESKAEEDSMFRFVEELYRDTVGSTLKEFLEGCQSAHVTVSEEDAIKLNNFADRLMDTFIRRPYFLAVAGEIMQRHLGVCLSDLHDGPEMIKRIDEVIQIQKETK